MRADMRSCGLAQPLTFIRIVKQMCDLVYQLIGIEEVDQPARFVMRHHLADRSDVAGHNGTFGCHRLQKAPAEHEGIGEIYVDPADLQKRQEILVGNAAQKMHTRPIVVPYLRAHLIDEDLFPATTVCPALRITHIVSADDQHMCVGSFGQKPRQAAHEDVVAAEGFEIAVDEGDHLVVPGQSRCAFAPENSALIGPDRSGIDAVVDDTDLLAKPWRVGIVLEIRR